MTVENEHALDKHVRFGQWTSHRHHGADGAIDPATRCIGKRLAHARTCFSQAKLNGFEGKGDGNKDGIGELV